MTAEESGAGLSLITPDGSILTLTNTTFKHCTCKSSSSVGGAIAIKVDNSYSEMTYETITFTNCSATTGNDFYLNTTVSGYWDTEDQWNSLIGSNTIGTNDMIIVEYLNNKVVKHDLSNPSASSQASSGSAASSSSHASSSTQGGSSTQTGSSTQQSSSSEDEAGADDDGLSTTAIVLIVIAVVVVVILIIVGIIVFIYCRRSQTTSRKNMSVQDDDSVVYERLNGN